LSDTKEEAACKNASCLSSFSLLLPDMTDRISSFHLTKRILSDCPKDFFLSVFLCNFLDYFA
jgi:hypothetical protein